MIILETRKDGTGPTSERTEASERSEKSRTSARPQRPRVERTAPIRNPNELFGAFGGGGDASSGDPISRSVGIGYKIVEQYLEHGRSLAAGVAPAAADRGATNGNHMADLASRMMRHTADLFEVWFQMMDVSDAARPRRSQETAAAPVHASPAPAPAPSTTGASVPSTGVVIQVESSRPAVVAVDLRNPPSGAVLVPHSLRSEDEKLSRIENVTIAASTDGGPVVVRVAIPDDQPDGIYNGMVIDETTSLPVGTISVRLVSKG